MIIGIDASRAVTRQRTGTEAYAYFLIQALVPAATAAGHRVRLYFNQAPPPDQFSFRGEVEMVHIPFPRLWTHIRLAAELHRRPPDVFFTPAHVIPLTYRRPGVATVHDLGYRYFPEAHTWRQLAYLRWSTGHNGRVARRVIADSQATKADLTHFYQVEPDKVDVIYPGIDPELGPVDEATATAVGQRYGIHPPYFLYLSTLQPRKNLSRLIHAYVAGDVPHQLVIAGKKGWLAQPILDEIFDLDLPLAKQIVLPGFVPDADKAALLSGATALLYPSLYEGFGFPLLEAQACGTAVLAANTSSLPEIAGESALLVDPLDEAAITAAIRRLGDDADLRRCLAAKGRVNARRFSWEKTAVQVLRTLEAAADG